MSLADLVLSLQSQVVSLKQRLEHFEARIGQATMRPAPLLAITSNPATGSYPAADANPNTYPIRFIDHTYTDSPGSQSASTNTHTTVAQTVARNYHPNGSYVPVGTIVSVINISNRWHFYHVDGLGAVVFTTTATLAPNGTASATVKTWNGSSYISGATITVHDVGVLNQSAANGSWGVAVLINGRYEVTAIEGDQGQRTEVFQTSATLAPGGTAAANVKVWNGTTYTTGEAITVHDRASLNQTAPNGSWGIASLINDRWEVLEIERDSSQQIEVFYTKADLQPGGTALADIRVWNGTSYTTGAEITVHDLCSLAVEKVPLGAFGIAALVNDRWEILDIEQTKQSTVYFELLGTLSVGGTASAKIKVWVSGSTYSDGATITVHDLFVLKQAVATGGKGFATKINGRWEVTNIDQPAGVGWHLALCSVSANFTTADATATVSWQLAMVGTAPAGVVISTSVTAQTSNLFTGAAGKYCFVLYDSTSATWRVLSVQC